MFLKAGMGAISLSQMAKRIMIAAPQRKSTYILIREIHLAYEDYPYRTPYEFGGRSVDRVTLLNVHCTVETVNGRVAEGFGSMTMGNEWAFPSKTLPYETTLDAMKRLAARIARATRNYN